MPYTLPLADSLVLFSVTTAMVAHFASAPTLLLQTKPPRTSLAITVCAAYTLLFWCQQLDKRVTVSKPAFTGAAEHCHCVAVSIVIFCSLAGSQLYYACASQYMNNALCLVQADSSLGHSCSVPGLRQLFKAHLRKALFQHNAGEAWILHLHKVHVMLMQLWADAD